MNKPKNKISLFKVFMSPTAKDRVGEVLDSDWQKHLTSKSSMEQLWLAFVMKSKYNKTWNGEDWINVRKT